MTFVDPVFVVQEDGSGMWVAECVDDRCEGAIHRLAYGAKKSPVQAAATRHRRFLKTLPVHTETRRKDICGECGQPVRANKQLRELVAELEARLALFEVADEIDQPASEDPDEP